MQQKADLQNKHFPSLSSLIKLCQNLIDLFESNSLDYLLLNQRKLGKLLTRFFQITSHSKCLHQLGEQENQRNQIQLEAYSKQLTNQFLKKYREMKRGTYPYFLYVQKLFTLKIEPIKQNQPKYSSKQLKFKHSEISQEKISQMHSNNSFSFYQTNQDNMIKNYANKFSNNQRQDDQECLGCLNFVKEGIVLESQDPFLCVELKNLCLTDIEIQNLKDEIKKCSCAILNCGGGYLFLNGSSSRIVNGIPLFSYENSKNFFHYLLYDCLACIQSEKFGRYVSFLKTEDHNNSLEIIRITLLPFNKKYVYSVKKTIGSVANKIIYPMFAYSSVGLVEVKTQQIYEFIHRIYSSGKKLEESGHFPKNKCGNFQCATVSSRNREIIQSLDLKKVGDQEPMFVFPHSTLLIISSEKHQNLIELIVKHLTQMKFQFKIVKPYLSIRQNALRVIYVMNHFDKFEAIKDNVERAIENCDRKISLIIVTKYLQIPGDNIKKELLDELDKEMKRRFDLVGARESRVEVKASAYNPKLFFFYGFEKCRDSIFAYLYLDSLNVMLQMVKQVHFDGGHKKKSQLIKAQF